MSKLSFSKSKFSVSDKNNFKNNVGWAFSPTLKYCWGRTSNLHKNCDDLIGKKSINSSPCHPELAAPLVADEKEAYKGGCSQSISGSSHRRKCSAICTQKSNVGVKPQPTMNCVGRIEKRLIKNSPCHPELAAPLVADEKEAYKGGCSQSISGSSHRQKCSTICTQKSNVGLKAQPTSTAFTLAEVFSPYYYLPRKVAFTLAEVLITLGIIGVVAAMTLPTLINDYQAKETVTRLKKVYSIMNQAYLQAQNDLGTIDNWGLSKSEFEEDPDTGEQIVGDQALAQRTLFWSRMSPYLKTLKTCINSDDSDCLSYPYTLLGGYSSGRNYEPSIILNDGTSFSGGWINNPNCGEKDLCADFSVDINGANRPNVVGRDIFYFRVYKHKINPIGVVDDTTRTFENYCLRNSVKDFNGYGCAAWVIFNENMDYLKCDGLSWAGKHKCK